MAALATLDTSACELLRTRLEDLDGVVRAVVEQDPAVLWLICEPSAEHEPLEVAAVQVMQSIGIESKGTRIRIATHADSGVRRRVRLQRVEREFENTGGLRVRVTLEWKDELFVGEAVGEPGPAIELRTAAMAAINAIHEVLGEDKGLRLTGLKPVRACDSDVVVVSGSRTGDSPQRFVGSVMAEPDPMHGAARAVLHALNRVLGNFLMTPV